MIKSWNTVHNLIWLQVYAIKRPPKDTGTQRTIEIRPQILLTYKLILRSESLLYFKLREPLAVSIIYRGTVIICIEGIWLPFSIAARLVVA